MAKKWGWIFVLFCMCQKGYAQDVHFSQFDLFHPKVNPALAGFTPDAYRFSLINRSQWRAVSEPFRTFGVHAEASDPLGANGLGIGLSFITDITGDSRFTTNNLALSGAYHFRLSNTKQYVSFGGQVSIIQQRIDYSILSFDNQYNGLFYDPSLSNQEVFGTNKLGFTDFGLGIAYQHRYKKDEFITGGIAWYNLAAVKVSYLQNPTIELDSRTTLFANADRKINEKYAVLPSLVWSFQGTLREFIIGGRARRVLKDRRGEYQAVYGGVYWRNKDALYIVAGVGINDWYGGLGYDINLSSLKEASNARGGFELVLTYKISKFNAYLKSHKSCPAFF